MNKEINLKLTRDRATTLKDFLEFSTKKLIDYMGDSIVNLKIK